MKVAAVTGLEAEARLFRRAGLKAVASGGIATRTVALAAALLDEGADGLVSFGIAGALAPQLRPGTLLLPRAVIEESGARHPVDAAWHARVMQAFAAKRLESEARDLFGADLAVASAARKATLFHATGAIAVDLESHLVAREAARAGRPFLVLRAIADPATRNLPPAAVNGLDASGNPALGRVLMSVARHPGQIAALLRLAGDTRRALSALGSAMDAKPF
jgi:hopanoid-associated phosphorylase